MKDTLTQLKIKYDVELENSYNRVTVYDEWSESVDFYFDIEDDKIMDRSEG